MPANEPAGLRRWAEPLKRTPFHPQWLAYLDEETWLLRVGTACRGRVVDIGCGRQRVRPFLAPGCQYLGIDYYVTATSMYRTRPDLYADARALPIAAGSADTVLLLEVIEHVPEPDRALSEAHRILAPDAVLVVSAPFLYPVHDAPYDFQRWTPHGLREQLDRQGFVIASAEMIGSPFETAALMVNIALAQAALRLVHRWWPTALIVLPLLTLTLAPINLLGWLLGRLDRDRALMPFGCRIWCRKKKTARDKVDA